MSSGRIILALAASTAIAGSAAQKAAASVVLLDFGATSAPSNADGSSTQSPGAASGAWTSATPTWNLIADSDVNINGGGGGLSYYDGTTAGTLGTGVALDLATSTVNSGTVGPTTITFGDNVNQPQKSSTLGSSINGGIYAHTSPITSGIFPSSGISTYQSLGANISGLVAATYTVYVTARNTNSAATNPENVWISSTNTTTSYTIPGSGSVTPGAGGALVEENTGTENSGPFSVNENYVVTTVTVSASTPDITIVSEGTSTNEARGFFNSIEIVSATPEPNALGTLTIIGSAFLALRRSRRISI